MSIHHVHVFLEKSLNLSLICFFIVYHCSISRVDQTAYLSLMVFSFLEFLSRFAMVGSVGRGASRSTLVYSSINGIIFAADVTLLILVNWLTALFLIVLFLLSLGHTLAALLTNVVDTGAHRLVESEFLNWNVLQTKAAFLGFNILVNFLSTNALGHLLR